MTLPVRVASRPQKESTATSGGQSAPNSLDNSREGFSNQYKDDRVSLQTGQHERRDMGLLKMIILHQSNLNMTTDCVKICDVFQRCTDRRQERKLTLDLGHFERNVW